MKNRLFTKLFLLFLTLGVTGVYAQKLQNFVAKDQNAINVFEPVKDDVEFEGIKARLGGAFSMQFQGLSHKNDLDNLIDIGKNFNLPTANMTIDAQLADGVRVNLDIYLSSNHHNEAWVKGGYLQIDKLDFIKEGLLENLMKYTTIKIGQMENNYGDAHLRRSDNANSMLNPFVGNYIMDAFTTEVGAEIYYLRNNWIFMGGISNGKLNQGVTKPGTTTPAFITKIGYDKQINEDFRFRLTGSMYHSNQLDRVYLYNGDRSGSRFYHVMEAEGEARPSDFAGRFNPGFAREITALMFNNLIKYKDFELFTTYERATGGDSVNNNESRTWNQFATDLVYRFGTKKNLYFGAKYNNASGKLSNSDNHKVSINRIETGLGWYLTKNIGTKIMYVNQNYNDFDATSKYAGGNFKGYAFEAVISF